MTDLGSIMSTMTEEWHVAVEVVVAEVTLGTTILEEGTEEEEEDECGMLTGKMAEVTVSLRDTGVATRGVAAEEAMAHADLNTKMMIQR